MCLDLIATSRDVEKSVVDGSAAGDHPGSRRCFVLLVDSLRYETSTDGTVMPNLVRLRRHSTHAKMQSSFDAVTVPAIRAAYTGTDRMSIFGFVKNFWDGEDIVRSLFSRASSDGLRSITYSSGAFVQFGAAISERRENAMGPGDQVGDPARQRAAVRDALRAYREQEAELVIAHLTYSDLASHERGTDPAGYRQAFTTVDTLIAEVAEQVAPSDTLIIMGDHGHDERGRHSMGLDVPTTTLFRGPGFSADTDLGEIPITSQFYLTSWALKLALPDGYTGQRHPQALLSRGPLPAAYTAATVRQSNDPSGAGKRGSFLLLAVALGAALALWLVDLLLTVHRPRWLAVCVWASVASLLAATFLPHNIWLCVLVWAGGLGATALKVESRARRRLLVLLLPIVGAPCMMLWGELLGLARPWLHTLSYANIAGCWIALAFAATGAALFLSPARVAWTVTAVAILLAFPTAYRYGAVGAMAPLWITWALCVGARELVHARRRQTAPPTSHLLLVAVMVMLLPMLLVESINFEFARWRGPLAQTPWSWALAVVLGQLCIFVRPTSGRRVMAAQTGAAMLVFTVAFRVLPVASWAPLLLAAICCAGAALATRMTLDATLRHELRRVLWIAGLMLLFFYSVRVPDDALQWMNILLGALALSNHYLQTQSRNVDAHRLLLFALGMLAAGWISLAWTLHRLEWSFLYDWFQPQFVEDHAPFFIPIIAARYAIPVLLVRLVLFDKPSEQSRRARRLMLALWGAKATALTLVAGGLAQRMPTSHVYLESIHEIGVTLVLVIGLL